MEERNGWQRVIHAAKEFDVTVIYHPRATIKELECAVPSEIDRNAISFQPLELNYYQRFLSRWEATFYIAYRLWQKRVYILARTLQFKQPFDVTHLVSLCGYREPGYLWRLPVPHVWGPIGGTHNYPTGYFQDLDGWNRLREMVRGTLNGYQLRFGGRIKRAAMASHIVAANREVQRDLHNRWNLSLPVRLETGLEFPPLAEREPRPAGRPLRVLWAGRLRQWKALPLLFHAIAQLPPDVQLEVRVLGDGSSKKCWEGLAEKLGIASMVRWIPWSTYAASIRHYEWADVFAFTSLRDTSGTGLLESLAAGAPILGVNHQGAADIMSDTSSIRVPVGDRQATIQGFADGLTRLFRDPELHHQLCLGARARADEFAWAKNADSTNSIYKRLCQPALARAEAVSADLRSASYANQPAI